MLSGPFVNFLASPCRQDQINWLFLSGTHLSKPNDTRGFPLLGWEPCNLKWLFLWFLLLRPQLIHKHGCMCAYLDEVVGAEAEELQQLKVAACRQDVLDHRRLQQNLGRGDKQDQLFLFFCFFHFIKSTSFILPKLALYHLLPLKQLLKVIHFLKFYLFIYLFLKFIGLSSIFFFCSLYVLPGNGHFGPKQALLCHKSSVST